MSLAHGMSTPAVRGQAKSQEQPVSQWLRGEGEKLHEQGRRVREPQRQMEARASGAPARRVRSRGCVDDWSMDLEWRDGSALGLPHMSSAAGVSTHARASTAAYVQRWGWGLSHQQSVWDMCGSWRHTQSQAQSQPQSQPFVVHWRHTQSGPAHPVLLPPLPPCPCKNARRAVLASSALQPHSKQSYVHAIQPHSKHSHARAHTHTHVHTHIRTCTHTITYTHTYARAHTPSHTHTYHHTHVSAHTITHT